MKLMLPATWSSVLLRLGVGVVFLYFGVDKFVHPEVWAGWINPRLLYYLPVSHDVFLYVNGGVEGVVGLLLILGLWTRIAASVAAVLLIGILATVGVTDVTVRDIAILAASLSLVLTGSKTLSIDNKFAPIGKKKRSDYIELR